MQKFRVGDIVRTRKGHPCGDDRWEVLRVGMDFRVRCLTCARMVMLPRPKFEHNVKAVLAEGGTDEAKALLNTPIAPSPGKSTQSPGKKPAPSPRPRRAEAGAAPGRPARTGTPRSASLRAAGPASSTQSRPAQPAGAAESRPARPAGPRPAGPSQSRPARPAGSRPAGPSQSRPARPAGSRPAGSPQFRSSRPARPARPRVSKPNGEATGKES